MGYVTGAKKPPSLEIEKDREKVPNKEYEHWYCQDQLILHAIIGSTSFSVMSTVVNANTSAEAWKKLQTFFANKSPAQILSFKERLSQTKRENKSVSDYFLFMKNITDELALYGDSISDIDLVVHILNGIDPEYHDIAATVHACDSLTSFEELQDRLLAHKVYLHRIDPQIDLVPLMANYAKKNGNSKHSKGSYNRGG
uniref:Uncharacterized protein LOC105061281 n=1 Tax=Elaeis guineensis var. tenera TaxID=51953 RepID=A0A6I9SIY2_ELAGV|nr:uncharacterized protein LOC105061281 [Elaeis guineensis]